MVWPETIEAVKSLASKLNCSEGEVLDRAVIGLQNGDDNQIAEVLELVQSLPDAAEVRGIVEEVMQEKIDARAASRSVNLASIPGVQVGAQGLQLEAKYHRSDGSKMSYAERREVDQKARVSEIAAQDTAAAAVARTDIEYDLG